MTRQERIILITCILASFVAGLDGSIVNIALPAITREFHSGLQVQQWVVDAYLITLGSLILVAGSLSDLIGRKRILRYGLIGFLATSLLCAVTPSSTILIIMRGLQGVAGALLVPSSLALITSHFKGEAESKAIGTWTAWTGIAYILGPILGGILIDVTTWRSIFAINILPVGITLWLMTKLPDDTVRGRDKQPVDYIGALLCTVGIGGTVYALIEQAQYGWSSPAIFLPLIIGLVSFVSFIYYESRAHYPMLPLSLFQIRNFAVGNGTTLVMYGGLGAVTFLQPIFLQQTGHLSGLQTGLALLPVTIIMFLLSPRFGALAGRFGPRFFMGAGPLVAGVGLALMTLVQHDLNYWTQLLPGVLVFGVGMSMTVAPLTTAILSAAPAKQSGVASAVNNAVARIAGLVAIAGLSIIIGSTVDIDGYRRGMLATALLLAVGGIVSAIGITNKSI